MKYISTLIYILTLLIIFIQTYFYYFNNESIDENFEINNSDEEKKTENINYMDDKSILKESKLKNDEEEIDEEPTNNDFDIKILETKDNEYFDIKNNYNNHKIINIDDPNPWNKIEVSDNFKKYFLKIYNFNDENFIKWKNLIKDLDYDITNKEIIIQNDSEEDALAIIHLILSNFNQEISFDEIIAHNLINISIEKAKISNVSKRLRKLILKSVYPDISKINLVNNKVLREKPLDLQNDINNINNINNLNNFEPIAYGGSEFAFF